MANYVELMEEIFEQSFEINRFKKFVVNFLNGSELNTYAPVRSAEIFAEFSFYVQGFINVGCYTDPNRKKVGLFVVQLKDGRDIEKARNKQRNFVARLIDDNHYDAAIAAFYNAKDTKWRLSFVRMDYELIKGKIKSSLTPAKRYSYLVGEGEPCHTAKESLLPIFQNESFRPTVDSIEEAFSVEKVTKQFFEKYKEKYLEVYEYLDHNQSFVEESKRKGFTTEQYAKKFMGQLVFLYFLQKKGWLGVKAFPKELNETKYKSAFFYNALTRSFVQDVYKKVDENRYMLDARAVNALSSKQRETLAKAIKGSPWGTGPRAFVRTLFNVCKTRGKNFFDDYLEPLFYEGLNKKRESDNYYDRLACRIPFLNGGLFEPLDDYDWENNRFSIPNEMFSNADSKGRDADGILDVFDRYNFTMNEDEPLEKEVAVDPEMLGKIFENLLDVKDRKSKGAFYTPREIVHYMCQESLTNYLVNTVGTPYEDTKDFVVYGEIMMDEDCSRESRHGLTEMLMPESIHKNLLKIDEALADVRVCDPAVGSGAFPMGMLSEIVKLREIITEYFARDMAYQPEFANWANDSKVFSRLNAERWRLRNEIRNAYLLKKETMRKSIFAVDIEPSAVDIAKLRMWLTLVVEQEINPDDPMNNKPLALPNLDCNIMCGNSLIDEFEGVDLSFDSVLFGNDGKMSLWTNQIDTELEKLYLFERDFFYADSHDKKEELRDKINSIKTILLKIAFTGAENKFDRFMVADRKHDKPFFLWKLHFSKVFRDKGGFDIVIGNPPYIDSENMTNSGLTWEREYIARKYKFAKGNWDIYIAFFELGFKLLSNVGSEIYITPDKWISKPFGEAMRSATFKNIKSILVAGRDVFESALVDSIITLIEFRECSQISIMHMDKKSLVFDRVVDKTILSSPYALDILFSDAIDMLTKIEHNTKPLSTIAFCENACATSDCYKLKEFLISLADEEQFSNKFLKIINTGTIGRFVSRWNKIEMRYLKDKYKFPVVDRQAFLSAFTNSYGHKSIKPKIIIKGLTLLDCCIDEEGIVIPGKSTMMISADINILYLLMGIINSKLMQFYIEQKYSSSSYNGGINFTKDMINNLPIKCDKTTLFDKITQISKNIVEHKRIENSYDSLPNEKQIDRLMYEIYELSKDEVNKIEQINI